MSIKPTQLGLDQSEAKCLEHCLALAAKAESVGSALSIDMEDNTYVDRTLALYEAVKRKHPSSGLALQAYLFRTPKDLERLRPLKPVIRLVKGAYAEPATVAFPKKSDTDAAYEAISRTMLDWAKTGECTPILGTHDIPLLGRLAAYADGTRSRQGQVRDPHALRHPREGAGALPSRGARGRDAHQLRQRLVPLVHAPPHRAAGERAVRREIVLRLT